MKSLSAILFFAISMIFNFGKAYACTEPKPSDYMQSGNYANVTRIAGSGCGVIDNPFFPKLPKIRLELPIDEELNRKDFAFKYLDSITVYTVNLESKDSNPPSCKVIEYRLKTYQKKLAQIDQILSDKLAKNKVLSFKEVRKIERLSREMDPTLEDLNRNVEVKVNWHFLKPPQSDGRIFYFLRYGVTDFKDFLITGPGLRWETFEDHYLPDYFSLDVSNDVTIEYEMPILDFCLGENQIKIQGKVGDELSAEDPILMATWEKDLKKSEQSGRWKIQSGLELHSNKVLSPIDKLLQEWESLK